LLKYGGRKIFAQDARGALSLLKATTIERRKTKTNKINKQFNTQKTKFL
jgi:hypothetical protein